MLLIRLLTLGILALGTSSMRAQESSPKPVDKEQARAVIHEVIENAMKQAMHKPADGSEYLFMMPVPTIEDQARVRNLGGISVEVLAEYVKDKDIFHQRLAIRLLGLFKSDSSLAALLEFANHALARGEAVSFLCMYPREKVQPLLEKFASSDSDSEVRRAARGCLNSYKAPGD